MSRRVESGVVTVMKTGNQGRIEIGVSGGGIGCAFIPQSILLGVEKACTVTLVSKVPLC